MAGGSGPAFGGMGGLDRVADVLAVADADMTQQFAACRPDGFRIAAVGPGLLAADVKLGGAVQIRNFRVARGGNCRYGFQRFRRADRFEIGQKPFPAAFAAKARLAHTAKAGCGIEEVGRIHPDDACLQLRRHIQRKVHILGPDRGGKAVAGVVGQLYRLGRGAEGHGNQHGAKDFFLHQGRGGRQAGDEGGRVEAARRNRRGGAIGFPLAVGIDHGGDRGQLDRVHDRTHVDAFVQRVADAQTVHAALQLFVEPFRHAFLHQQARSGAADLALIEPDRIHQPLDGAVQIGVVKDDVGRFAAQLQRQRLAGACGRLPDFAPHGGGAGEGDLVDAGVRHKGGTRCPVTGHDVQHAFRQARLAAEFGEQKGGQRGVFGGFQHDGIAGGQRRGHFPGQHQQRKVPRDHRAADPQRGHVGQFRRQKLRQTGVIVEMPGDQRHVDIAAFPDRLAIVHGFQNGQQARVLLHQTGQRIEMLRPLMPRKPRPFRLGAAGCGDGGIQVFGRALGHLGQHLGRRGVLRLERLARFGEAAVDPVAEAAAMRLEPVLRLGAGFRGGAVAHLVENVADGHGLSHRMAVGGRIAAGQVMLQLAFDIAQKR